MNDLKFACRQLLKNPGFTAVAVLTLALGIGANTAIFSVLNAVLLRALPYADSDQLVWVFRENLSRGHKGIVLTPGRFFAVMDQNQSFSACATVRPVDFVLLGEGKPEQIQALSVSANLAEVLGVRPHLGRSFLPGENEPGNHRVVVISHQLWQRRFGGSESVIGETIRSESESFTIVGVLPPGFEFPIGTATGPYGLFKGAELWTPAAWAAEHRSSINVDGHSFMVARLKPGVTATQADAEVEAIARRFERQREIDQPDGWRTRAVPLKDQFAGASRPHLLLLLGSVSLVLLIICVNVANLSLVRGAARFREMAVRVALGASRARIARQLLTESVLLGLLGGMAGVLLAHWGVETLVFLLPADLPRIDEVRIDSVVLGFTVAVSVLTGMLSGLAPAIQTSLADINGGLKEGGRALSGGVRQRRLQHGLVIGEIALSLALLVGAGLLLRSLHRLNSVDPGFETEHVLTMSVALSPTRYPDHPARQGFAKQLLDSLESIPGIQSAASSLGLPFAGGRLFSNQKFWLEGEPEPARGEEQWIRLRGVSPRYFETIGVPILKGRDFGPQDEAGGKLIVNESFVRRFCAGREPIGLRLQLGEVIGVVKDSLDLSLDLPVEPRAFSVTYGFPVQSILVRAKGHPQSIASAVEKAVFALDPDQPVQSIRTLTQIVSQSVAQRRSQAVLLGLLAAIAVMLAGIGIYGVMAALVSERRSEIGIRMALGAQTADIFRLVVSSGLKLTALGVAIGGLSSAFGLTRVLRGVLFEISPTDPLSFLSAALLLASVALAASLLPARRAAKVDPMASLRAE